MRVEQRITLLVMLPIFTAMLILSGCAALDGSTTQAGGSDAMMCPTCETVWVKELAHEGQTHVLRSKKKMDCPDCDTMAVDYLEDGSIAPHNCHKCKTVPVPLPHDEFYEYPGLG